ncbi:MAG: Ig-like domain-containing protein [Bacteroidia bacterium]
MRHYSILLSLFVLLGCTSQPSAPQTVVSDDIERFWTAYDKIISTQDTTQQLEYLSQLYLEPGSPGLKALMERRGYTAQDYLEAIRNYPSFWASVRKNTLRSKEFADEIEAQIAQLKTIYPQLKPAKVYFTMGALMTGGTTLDSLVLIGSEIAMADSSVVTDEFPDWLGQNLRRYFDTNPIHDVALLNIHEYVHTQQNTYGYDLLSQSLFEGVAEFVSTKAIEKPSSAPAVNYGKNHEERVKQRFVKEMFSPNWDDWLYNNFENEFKVRDLGYFAGYAICEKYYEDAADKQQAIREMIELDFGNQEAVENFVQKTGYFSESLGKLKQDFTSNRPEVVGIRPIANGAQNVDPTITEITVEFSVPMSKRFRGFEYGPLGEDHVLGVQAFNGFSEDGKTATFTVKMEPGQHYQLELSPRFRTEDGSPLEPYLIDIQTKK